MYFFFYIYIFQMGQFLGSFCLSCRRKVERIASCKPSEECVSGRKKGSAVLRVKADRLTY